MRKLVKRVREINLKYSSLSGQVSSKKLGQEVQFESSLERDLIYLLEFDIEVEHYLEQPLTIAYKDEAGKSRSYTPDFIISYHNKFKKTELVEVKYESYLITHKSELGLKFNAATEYCKKRNMVFKIYTDVHIREKNEAFLSNAKFLSRYKFAFDAFPKEHPSFMMVWNQVELILNQLAVLRSISIIDFIEILSADNQLKRAESMYLIWYLMSKSYIDANLHEPLGLHTKIWLEESGQNNSY